MAEIADREWIHYLMLERVQRGERDTSTAAVDLAWGLLLQLQAGSVTAAEARAALEVATGMAEAIDQGSDVLPGGALVERAQGDLETQARRLQESVARWADTGAAPSQAALDAIEATYRATVLAARRDRRPVARDVGSDGSAAAGAGRQA